MIQDGDKPYDLGEDVVLDLLWDGKEEKKVSIEQQDEALMKTTQDLSEAAASAEAAAEGKVAALNS